MTDKKKHRWWKRSRDAAGDAAEAGVEAAAEGCTGCGIDLVIGLTILAALPLLLSAF